MEQRVTRGVSKQAEENDNSGWLEESVAGVQSADREPRVTVTPSPGSSGESRVRLKLTDFVVGKERRRVALSPADSALFRSSGQAPERSIR